MAFSLTAFETLASRSVAKSAQSPKEWNSLLPDRVRRAYRANMLHQGKLAANLVFRLSGVIPPRLARNFVTAILEPLVVLASLAKRGAESGSAGIIVAVKMLRIQKMATDPRAFPGRIDCSQTISALLCFNSTQTDSGRHAHIRAWQLKSAMKDRSSVRSRYDGLRSLSQTD